RKKADAVLFPECAVTGYSYPFGRLDPAELRDAVGVVRALAREAGMNVLLGTPLFAGRKLYNTLLVLDRGGKPVHVYAKCQLTEADRKAFTPGDAVSLFELDGVPCTA